MRTDPLRGQKLQLLTAQGGRKLPVAADFISSSHKTEPKAMQLDSDCCEIATEIEPTASADVLRESKAHRAQRPGMG